MSLTEGNKHRGRCLRASIAARSVRSGRWLRALGATHLLWLFQRTMLGEVKEKNSVPKDLSWREIAVFAPLIVWACWIGLNPQPYFRVLERPVAKIVERVHPGYYAERHLVNPLDAAVPSAALR